MAKAKAAPVQSEYRRGYCGALSDVIFVGCKCEGKDECLVCLAVTELQEAMENAQDPELDEGHVAERES